MIALYIQAMESICIPYRVCTKTGASGNGMLMEDPATATAKDEHLSGDPVFDRSDS